MQTLFARYEVDRVYGRNARQVALYRDGEPLPVAVYPFHYESRPTPRQRTVMHNCASYRLEWRPELIGPPVHVGELRWRAQGYGPGRDRLAAYR